MAEGAKPESEKKRPESEGLNDLVLPATYFSERVKQALQPVLAMANTEDEKRAIGEILRLESTRLLTAHGAGVIDAQSDLALKDIALNGRKLAAAARERLRVDEVTSVRKLQSHPLIAKLHSVSDAEELQQVLREFEGRTFGSKLDVNQAVCKTINDALRKLDNSLRCQKECCHLGAVLACKPRRTSPFVFQFAHFKDGTSTYHLGRSVIPRLDVMSGSDASR